MIGFLMGMTVSYIFIIIAGLVATFLYDACAAALRALGDTVTPLVWFIMVIPLLVKIYTMPVLRKQPVSVSLKN